MNLEYIKKVSDFIKNIFRNKLNRIYFFVFVISFIITEVGREFYRPYIYRNNINDFGFADTIGNTFGTIATIFFILFLVVKPNFRKETFFIFFIIIFHIAYEISQKILPNNNFDWKDIIATIIAGIISYVIYQIIVKMRKPII